jgi:hypothetical protein
VAWEGDDFPENQGWERLHGPDGAQATRTLTNGAMTIDGLQTPPVYDGSRISGNGNFDPDPSKVFVMRWRMRVEQIEGFHPWDPVVAVVSDTLRAADFIHSYDRIRSAYEGATVAFAPGVYHTYDFRSPDTITYVLTIDGAPALQGVFTQTAGVPFVAWGDRSSGVGSRTTWDYFRFGVVPEGSAGAGLLLLGIAGPRLFRVREHCQ